MFSSKFCPDCGHPAVLEKIDGRHILNEIQSVLNFERGLFYTIKELLLNPGLNVRTYLTENRNRIVKPVIFIIATSLIYSLCNAFFKFEDSYIKYSDIEQNTTTRIFEWIQNNYGYANIILGVFIALWTKLFFKKYEYNIFEILILLCFVMGIGMLIFSAFGLIQGLTQIKLMQFSGVLAFAYTTWAIAGFFDRRNPMNYVRAFFAYFLGMTSFVLLAILIGNMIDYLVRM